MAGKLKIFRGEELLAEFASDQNLVYALGNAPNCHISLPDAKNLAPRQAELFFVGNQWWIRNCSTDDGELSIGSRKIACEALVGDVELACGNQRLSLRCPAAEIEEQGILNRLLGGIMSRVMAQLNMSDSAEAVLSDEALRKRAENLVGSMLRENPVTAAMPLEERERLQLEIIQDLLFLGPLETLLADDDVTEIMVVDYERIYVEKNGKIQLSQRIFRSPEHLLTVIERIVAPIGRRIDESSPLVDARLADGSRVNAVIPPITPDGSCLTIRKFGKAVFTVDRLVEFGSMTAEMGSFLHSCVKLRKNIVVSGGTGSGKTSLLNALSQYLPKEERIVTIEDSLELKLQQDHVVRMEARPPNVEGKGDVSIRRLVQNSLRMRPDRIVIGECRGGEALDMLQAMNTGHDGSLTTVHANNPHDTVSRLETLVLMAGMDLPLSAVRNQIVSAINLIVQTSRMSDGSRKVVSITEIAGQKNGEAVLNEIFTYRQAGIDKKTRQVVGSHVAVAKPTFLEEFANRGIPIDEAWFSLGK